MAEEFEINKENRERAQKLAEMFHDQVQQADPSSFSSGSGEHLNQLRREFSNETPIEDVVEDVRAVSRLVYIARRTDQKVPVIEVTDIGAIPVIQLDSFPGRFFGRPFWPEDEFLLSRRDFFEARYRGVNFVPIEGMLKGFKQGLSLFLGHRFQGFDLWRRSSRRRNTGSAAFGKTGSTAGGPPPPGTAAPGGGGFYVELNCGHYHLAAYASPAYALTWRNLGSFTTPAKGVLPAGTWIFGAQGGMFPSLIHDPKPVYIPTNFTPSTKCF